MMYLQDIMHNNRRSPCPIACTLDLVGDKWTMLLLRDILFFKKTRFEEFLDSPEKISSNILTDRLHKLEKYGLITKAPYSNHRLRMAYTATERGQSLVPILKQIVQWGLCNIDDTKTLRRPEPDCLAETWLRENGMASEISNSQ